MPYCTLLQAQTYFNVRFGYSTVNNSDAAKSLLENDSGYLVAGMTGAYYIGVANFNTSGDMLWTKKWGKSYSQYWLGDPGSFIQSKDMGYTMFGTYKDSIVKDAALMIKLDNSLDTLWTKIFYDTINNPPYYYFYLFQGIQESSHHYTACGVKKPYGGPSLIWLVHLSNNGSIIWNNSFGFSTWYYNGYSVIQTSDGGYAIGGFRFLIGNDNSGDPIVIKTDSLGNQQWMKNLGGQYKDNKAMICLDQDGNILMGTVYADTMSGDDPHSRINIVKLDNQGNVIWNKKYGETRIYNYLLNIRCLPNGDVIACGSAPDNFPHIVGWILKINNDGDSLWYREYDILTGSQSSNELYDIIGTSDNGLISCGYLWPHEPDTGSEDAWVIKLDSLGCEGPDDCWVGMEEKPEDDVTNEELWVYPNPAADKVIVRWPMADSRVPKEMRLIIYDVLGTKVKEINIPAGQKEARLDVSTWHEGLYAVILIEKGQIVAREKVVVVH
ncbi:MAG: T9SS type A sorting domain-containing protein [Bacteroidetes bacterium]|nr:T9SS type A sorting domain-containing protein [Bacteroidota bacterium]